MSVMLMIIKLLVVIFFSFIGISEARINTYVSIIPQKFFVQSIGGDKVAVNAMVAPGANPATYEPKPKQMVDMSSTDIYFSIGVPFEKSWMKKLSNLNPEMKIVRTDEGIRKRSIENHIHDDDNHKYDNDNHGSEDNHGWIKDPHIWLDPIGVIKQAEIIAAALCTADSANCPEYLKNKAEFIKKASLLNHQIESILQKSRNKSFMVFHPSWGYFADRYGLKQIPVEMEGKEPKPSDLKTFVEISKELKLKTIFVQPQFSKKSAELIAKETGAKVTPVDPLAYDWDKNLLYAAKLIAKSF